MNATHVVKYEKEKERIHLYRDKLMSGSRTNKRRRMTGWSSVDRGRKERIDKVGTIIGCSFKINYVINFVSLWLIKYRGIRNHVLLELKHILLVKNSADTRDRTIFIHDISVLGLKRHTQSNYNI